MKQEKYLTIRAGWSTLWALGATIIALVLLGVLLGQQIGRSSAGNKVGTHSPNPVNSTSPREGGFDTEAKFPTGQDLPNSPAISNATLAWPTQWRTQTDGDLYDGYAILLDPGRRQVIVEQCQHRGFFDEVADKPIDVEHQFCKSVLHGQLTELTQTHGVALQRDGTSVELSLSLESNEQLLKMALSFPGHTMDLIPGSKNDLRQAMVKTPEMKEQKRKRDTYLFAKRNRRQP